jgi:predicted ATPase
MWHRLKLFALTAVGGIGVMTLIVAVATVVLIVTDPVRTADAVNARDAVR